jgi:hypothetical protein
MLLKQQRRQRRHHHLLSSLPLSMVMLVVLLIATLVSIQSATAQGDGIDYTCNPRLDYSDDNKCPTIQDGKCDDPSFGGNEELCRNQDCIDCNIQCK